MNKSNYTWTVVEGVLCIIDKGPHDKYKTVTNNAENVLEEIKQDLNYLGKPFPGIVIYKDSTGMWDGMEFHGERLEFYALRVEDKDLAIQKASERFVGIKTDDNGRGRGN